jgi:hypothetical protein
MAVYAYSNEQAQLVSNAAVQDDDWVSLTLDGGVRFLLCTAQVEATNTVSMLITAQVSYPLGCGVRFRLAAAEESGVIRSLQSSVVQLRPAPLATLLNPSPAHAAAEFARSVMAAQ